MNRIVDKAVVLRRVNYGESDRIVTLLTENNGKISVFAKGARKQKSRLSGGIELLSLSEVSFIRSRSNLYALVGANIITSYGMITTDMNRLNLIYDALRVLDKMCEETSGQEYFSETLTLLKYMQNKEQDPLIVKSWFDLILMKKTGVLGDVKVQKSTNLIDKYNYDISSDEFLPVEGGTFSINDIKLLVLLSKAQKPILFQGEVDSHQINKLTSRQLVDRVR